MANYKTATDAEIKALVGKTGIEGAFWSVGVAKGKGFSGKPVIFNISMPRGTKAMYCEPFSAYGHGSGKSRNDVQRQSSVGSEAEILIYRRGTTYRVTKVEKSNDGKWYIDLEVIEQKPVPFPYAGAIHFNGIKERGDYASFL